MKLSVNLIPSFKHKSPEGTFYVVEEFKKNVFRILICYKQKFSYNDGETVKCCWGFYNYKKCEFYFPVNSKTVGKSINFENTTPYSAIPIKTTSLEKAFV